MIRLVQAPFDPGEALGEFCRDRKETGAVASFTGLARAESGRTDILELEAYPGFTEREIARHEAAARERFPGFGFRHGYGLGVLAVGPRPDPAVAALCAAEGNPEGDAVRRMFQVAGERWIADQMLRQSAAERRG